MARCHHQHGQHEACLDDLEAAGADGDSARSLLLRAAALHALGRSAAAGAALERAREQVPEDPHVWRILGEQAVASSSWSSAERAFRHALRLDPDDPDALHGLGVCALKRNAFAEVLEQIDSALAGRFFFPGAHYHRGFARLCLGKPDEALSALSIAICQAPLFAQAYELAMTHL